MLFGRVNLGRVTTLLQQAPEVARPVMDGLLRESARNLISSSGNVPGLVQVTPPHSQGKAGVAAKRQGENAVMLDVWKVYATPGKIYELIKARGQPYAAASFWRAFKTKDWKQADAIMTNILGRGFDQWDDGAAHMKRRNKRGRVKGKEPSIYLKYPSRVRGYISRRKKNVGLLASTIPARYSGRYGPLRGVPSWISRHSSSWASGFMFERKSRGKASIIIGINAGALDREMQRRFNYVLEYRIAAMKRQLPYVAREIEKKIALQLSRA